MDMGGMDTGGMGMGAMGTGGMGMGGITAGIADRKWGAMRWPTVEVAVSRVERVAHGALEQR